MTKRTATHRLADDLGMDVSRLNSAMWWLEYKAAAVNRTDGRFLYTQERRMARGIKALFDKQIDYLLEELKNIVPPEGKGIRRIETKALNDELKRIMDNMPHELEIVTTVRKHSILGMLKGGQRTIRDVKLSKLGISFTVKHPEATRYMQNLTDIHLSQRYGSIGATTRRNIIDIVAEGVATGDSYTALAKRIREQGKAGVFSPARAEMIAVNQMASAYEEGKAIVADEAQRIVGDIMMVAWQTVNDGRVTPECHANQNAGWIPKGTMFPSGHDKPPRFPRCRCAGKYDFAENLRLTGQINQRQVDSLPKVPSPDITTTPPDTVQAVRGDGNTSISVPVHDGHVYHATPVNNLQSIASSGLSPRTSQLDINHGDNNPRLYFGVNPAVTGSGLDMDKAGTIVLRVRSDALNNAHIDPNIPSDLALFVRHNIAADLLEVQDEFGRWIPLLAYLKGLSAAL